VGVIEAIALSGGIASAQITPDTTLGAEGSVVTPDIVIQGVVSDLIDGGAIRGANLFHSFEQFNINEGRGAYFTNPAGIDNILSRVTGSNPSSILGRLGVLGDANLFLINPNGILFGKNASLDVGGSFVATTANALQFGEQGFWSATNPEAPGLLTINPSAFFFNQLTAGAIVNQSIAPDPIFPSFIDGLRVPNGENLVLLGGNVSIDGGWMNAFGGRVEIGAVAGTGTVALNADSTLNFPTNVQRADVSFTNGAQLSVSLDNGGAIAITARNIDFSA
jgi:filamentous hemagglutinin family protein